MKSTGEQIDPHLPKKHCDRLVDHGEIYGCGKPFRVEPQKDDTLLCYNYGYIQLVVYMFYKTLSGWVPTSCSKSDSVFGKTHRPSRFRGFSGLA